MMLVIHRYLTRLMAKRLLVIFGILVTFVLFVDLMINAKEVIQSRDGEMTAIAKYAILRLPEIASLLLAPATLLAALAVLASLIRHFELVAIWNSHISPLRTCLAVAPFAFILGLCQFIIDGEAVPRTLQRLNDWGVGDYGRTLSNETTDGAFWLHSGTDIVRLPSVVFDLAKIDRITVFQRDLNGRLIARVDASGIRMEGDRWVLSDVIRRTVQGPKVETFENLPWSTSLPLDDLRTMASHPAELTVWQLYRFVTNKSFGIYPPHAYSVWLNQRLAASLAPSLLMLLVILLAQKTDRRRGISDLLVKGLSIGFAYFILVKLSHALGEANLVPALISAWTPPLILVVVASSIGFHHESASASNIGRNEPPGQRGALEERVLGVVSGQGGAARALKD